MIEKLVEIKLVELGVDKGPGLIGKRICKDCIKRLENDPDLILIFNFERLSTVSPSVVSELFGGLGGFLGENIYKRVRFKFPGGAPGDLIKSLVAKSLPAKSA